MRFIALLLYPNEIFSGFRRNVDTSLCYNSEYFLYQKILDMILGISLDY